jgi:hypothetical protein
MDIHGDGKSRLSCSLLNPFVRSPFFNFPDLLLISPQYSPGHLLHFTEQLFRVGSQDRAHPQFLDLFDSRSEISLGAIDEP